MKQTKKKVKTLTIDVIMKWLKENCRDGKSIVVDSWERPELFRELLKFAYESLTGQTAREVFDSRHR